MSCTTADSYLEASREAGAVAELAAYNKMVKYAGPSSQGEFVQIAVEFHGPVNGEAFQFLSELAVGDWRRRPFRNKNEASSFLFQRIYSATF